jgi:hypothetical protein
MIEQTSFTIGLLLGGLIVFSGTFLGALTSFLIYHKKIIKRKVVCVFGNFDDKSDFVLEPCDCPDGHGCEFCKDSFWIRKTKGKI